MNIEPKNHLFEKENHLPNLHFWVPCSIFKNVQHLHEFPTSNHAFVKKGMQKPRFLPINSSNSKDAPPQKFREKNLPKISNWASPSIHVPMLGRRKPWSNWARWFNSWPFHPQTLEVTNNLWKGHLAIPKRSPRITCFFWVSRCICWSLLKGDRTKMTFTLDQLDPNRATFRWNKKGRSLVRVVLCVVFCPVYLSGEVWS